MAANARDILNHKYYRQANGGKKDVLEDILKQAKKNAPSRIPYYLSVSKELPGWYSGLKSIVVSSSVKYNQSDALFTLFS